MIHASQIAKHYGPKYLYKESAFQINAGEKIGLVGPNGAGKTTLFRLILGQERPDEGNISKPDKLTIGYFSQTVAEMSGRTVLEESMAGNEKLPEIKKRLSEIEHSLTEPLDDSVMTNLLEEYGNLQVQFEQMGGYDIESRASEILTGLGIPPEDHNRLVDTYSGGWKMRIALSKILLMNPDLLLMDEPTNHLDLESIEWLESWLKLYKGAILMTCHDRFFMNQIVNKIIEVANQKITTYGGNYDFYETEREIRLEKLIASAKRQEEMLAKEKEFISRFAARASHAAQVQSRVKKIEKIDIIEVPTEERAMSFEWPIPPRGSDEVVKLESLGKIWKKDNGNDHLVFRGATALVKRLDRIAVVGINGAGKSTLMKIIAGQIEPTEGKCTIGPSNEIGYFSQNSLDVLNPQNTIVEEVMNNLDNPNLGYARNLLGAFKFSGEEADKKISILSGGEKSRVVLATILAKSVNLLILDEPTNHLDIKSREVLLEAIKNFPGTVMMVSHDRHFLKEITTRVFEIDKHQLRTYDGDWQYYLSKKL